MLRILLDLSIISVLFSSSACNIVELRERLVRRSFRSHGLVAKTADFGPDHVAYWEGGTGPTLVLLHGFGADGTWGWSEQVPVLSKHFHLVIPDLLWFGGSRSVAPEYTVKHQVTAVRELLNYLNVEKCDLMGISYGGVVALALNAEIPKQVNRVVIVASPGSAYTQKDVDALLRSFRAQSVSELVLPKNTEDFDRLMRIAYHKPPYIPGLFKGSLVKYLQDLPGGERHALLSENIATVTSEIRRIPAKALIIWGSDDPLFPLEIGRRLQHYYGRHSQLKVIEGGRHAPNLEYVDEFNQLVLDFLLPKQPAPLN